MARIPYADPDQPDLAVLVGRVVAERGSVLHLYRMLLHAPEVAEGWLALFTAVRQRSGLAGALRELAILRVAALNGAPYESDQHAPIALAEGLEPHQLDAVADWEDSDAFDDVQRAVLAYTDAMTRSVHVPDAVFEEVRRHFDDRGMVELTVTVAGYNMVSRVLEALAIRSDDRP